MRAIPETDIHLPTGDREELLGLEWLVTNGLGGYASSTVAGANTRRYHGLLVAATLPPAGRRVLLAGVIEGLIAAGGTFEFSTAEYQDGTIHPAGFNRLTSFRLAGQRPVFTYRMGSNVVEKTLWMDHGQNATWIQYTLLESAGPVTLRLLPLVTNRNFHSETRSGQLGHMQITLEGETVVVSHSEGPPLCLRPEGAAAIDLSRTWFWNVAHRLERDRGFDCVEDLLVPCEVRVQLGAGDSFALAAWSGPPPPDRSRQSLQNFDGRATELVNAIPTAGDSRIARLALAADQFLVRRGHAEIGSVMAGYHWFGDWGRDTMIALPGLTLATGRPNAMREILCEYAAHLSEGMLPNRFPDAAGEPEYNNVDATLWWFEAVAKYMAATGDASILEALLTPMVNVVDWHIKGTRYGIGMDPEDGLLRAGRPGTSLTWMDARIGDRAVTPRYGKPVEVNALWYSALRLLEAWLEKVHMDVGRVRGLADRVAISFRRRFWNDRLSCLFDVVDGSKGDDPAMRPNQLFALSLTNPLLHGERARAVVEAVRKHLVTPYGLRSLAPADAAYRGRYEGGPVERDSAYHQGTVWPWLIGAYVDAHIHAHGSGAGLEGLLDALLADLDRAGLGSIAEVYDGDPPHRPGGCVAQAWSVAEVLRAYSRLRAPGQAT